MINTRWSTSNPSHSMQHDFALSDRVGCYDVHKNTRRVRRLVTTSNGPCNGRHFQINLGALACWRIMSAGSCTQHAASLLSRLDAAVDSHLRGTCAKSHVVTSTMRNNLETRLQLPQPVVEERADASLYSGITIVNYSQNVPVRQ